MTETVRGDVLTKQRALRRDVRIEESDRGGIKFYAPSYLDVLVDNEIITQSHRSVGMVYWSLRESAMAFITGNPNPLFQDVTGDEDDGQPPENPYNDDVLELFITLNKMLKMRYRRAIDSCCSPIQGNALAIVWAYGENTIYAAFEDLLKKLPDARDDVKRKSEKNENICCFEF